MREHMLEAIRLAAVEHPHPNPKVGALVLDAAGQVVGRGSHAGPGTPHAEELALAQAGDRARGGTVVVTLEPCSHWGRTAPCTEAVIASGVTRVVAGVGDPDQRVSGRGFEFLRNQGVEIVTGVAAEEVYALDPGYFHHRTTGRPLITVKMAATLDGQSAAADGTSKWITGPAAREDAHRLRAASDAVVVGAGTIIADDPRLTVRLADYEGPQPRPVVVAGRNPIPPGAAVFGRDPIVYSAVPLDLPAEVVVMPGPDGVDLESMVADLGKRDVLDVLCEGGATLAGALLRGGMARRLVVYLAGSLGGGVGRPMLEGVFSSMDQMTPVDITGLSRLGPDLRVEAEVR